MFKFKNGNPILKIIENLQKITIKIYIFKNKIKLNTVFIMKVLNKLTIEKYHRQIKNRNKHYAKISKARNNIPTEYTNRKQSISCETSNTILQIIYKRVRGHFKHNSRYFVIRHTIIACHLIS